MVGSSRKWAWGGGEGGMIEMAVERKYKTWGLDKEKFVKTGGQKQRGTQECA